MILKRSGWSLIIIHLTQSLSAAGLGCGNSLAVSEYPTVGPISSSSTSHRYSLACIGLLPLAQYCSSPLAQAFLFNMTFFSPPNANVSVMAVRCLFLTSSLVEQLTWILALPCWPTSSLTPLSDSLVYFGLLLLSAGKTSEVTPETLDVKSGPTKCQKGLWLQLMCCAPFRLLSQDLGTEVRDRIRDALRVRL